MPQEHTRLPTYERASWRNTTPVDEVESRIGIGFDLEDGRVLRLKLRLENARHLVESILEFLSIHEQRSQSDSLAKNVEHGGVDIGKRAHGRAVIRQERNN